MIRTYEVLKYSRAWNLPDPLLSWPDHRWVIWDLWCHSVRTLKSMLTKAAMRWNHEIKMEEETIYEQKHPNLSYTISLINWGVHERNDFIQVCALFVKPPSSSISPRGVSAVVFHYLVFLVKSLSQSLSNLSSLSHLVSSESSLFLCWLRPKDLLSPTKLPRLSFLSETISSSDTWRLKDWRMIRWMWSEELLASSLVPLSFFSSMQEMH